MIYPSAADRDYWHQLPVTREIHAQLFPHIDALHSIERCTSETPRPAATLPLRVLSWNQERGRFPDQATALIAEQNADVVLLSEMDIGMARTHQRHTIRDLATRLNHHSVFGTEFIEFSLGSDIHKTPNPDPINQIGLHGNAILSRQALTAPRLIRLEQTGRWFTDPHGGEKRIGGRLAIAASLTVMINHQPTPIIFVTVHLESHTDPADRAAQVAVLLEAIDAAYGRAQPVIIGGDFNTNTLSRRNVHTAISIEALRAAEPNRFLSPEPYEPLFAHLSAYGYDWQAANVATASTQRFTAEQTTHAPDGRPLMHIDWLFTRGLSVADPAIIPAFAPDGDWLSDHDALAVTIIGLTPAY